MVFYYKFENRKEPRNWKKLILYVYRKKTIDNEIFDNMLAPKILAILDYVEKSKYFQNNKLTRAVLLDRLEYLLFSAKHNIVYAATIADSNRKKQKASSKEEVDNIKKQQNSNVLKIKKGKFLPLNVKWHDIFGKPKSKMKKKFVEKMDALQNSTDNEYMDYIAGDTLLSILDLYRLCRRPFWHTEILEKFYRLYPIYEKFENSFNMYLNSCDTAMKKKELPKLLRKQLHKMLDKEAYSIYNKPQEYKEQLIKRLEQWYFQEYGKKIKRRFRWWEENVVY